MFKYFGAKYKLARVYPSPIFPIIVEPFAGSASYAVHHRRLVERVILIEKDAQVVDLWLRLLSMSADEIRSMPVLAAGSMSDDILYAFAAGRTTRDTPSGEFVVSPRMEQRFQPMIERVASVVDECRHFEVIEGDYTDAPDVAATWFIDPPYQSMGGRWDRTRGGRYLYGNKDFDYSALAQWSVSRRGQVIACEQGGADWLPWNGSVEAPDNTHRRYTEVWWEKPA